MAFTGSFVKVDIRPGLDIFKLIDDSNYGDEGKGTFSARGFYLMMIDGTFVKSPNGTDLWDFSYADYPSDQITISVLTADVALQVYMVWTSTNPQVGSVYADLEIFDFKDYANQYKYNLTGYLAANRNLRDNQNWFGSYDSLQFFIDASSICVINQDQYSSQWAINNATYLTENPNLFY